MPCLWPCRKLGNRTKTMLCPEQGHPRRPISESCVLIVSSRRRIGWSKRGSPTVAIVNAQLPLRCGPVRYVSRNSGNHTSGKSIRH